MAEFVYRCQYTATPPVINGVLDDPVWQQAGVVQLVRNQEGGTPRFVTTRTLAVG